MGTPGPRDTGAGNWVKRGKGGWESRAKLVAWRQVLSKFRKRAKKGTPETDAQDYELQKTEDLGQYEAAISALKPGIERKHPYDKSLEQLNPSGKT